METKLRFMLKTGEFGTIQEFLNEIIEFATEDKELNCKLCGNVHRYIVSCNTSIRSAMLHAPIKVHNDDDTFVYRADNIDVYVRIDEKNEVVTFLEWKVTDYTYIDERIEI